MYNLSLAIMALGFSQATEVNKKVVHCCKADGVGLIKFDLHSKQPLGCRTFDGFFVDCPNDYERRYNWGNGIKIVPDKRYDFRYGGKQIGSMTPWGNKLYYYHGNRDNTFWSRSTDVR